MDIARLLSEYDMGGVHYWGSVNAPVGLMPRYRFYVAGPYTLILLILFIGVIHNQMSRFDLHLHAPWGIEQLIEPLQEPLMTGLRAGNWIHRQRISVFGVERLGSQQCLS